MKLETRKRVPRPQRPPHGCRSQKESIPRPIAVARARRHLDQWSRSPFLHVLRYRQCLDPSKKMYKNCLLKQASQGTFPPESSDLTF